MSKTKWYILAGIFLCLIAVGITITSIKSVKADTSTTFPVDEAGIAAYVKIDNNIDITALAEAYSTIEKQAESYVIGKVPVTNNPLVYVGLDGWIVAYFLNTEEASKIAGGTKATTLEDAIDYMVGKIGVTYLTPIKYYDFEFPAANKMTLITENTPPSPNGFYVTVPGTLYEASYRLRVINAAGMGGWLTLKVDDVTVYEKDVFVPSPFPPDILYDEYDLSTYFNPGVPHYVTLIYSHDSSCATVLIYKN